MIVKRDAEGTDVLVLGFSDGRMGLPVFGFEEEAGMFVWLESAGDGWRVAEISEADLASLLRGPCARVRSVLHPFADGGVREGP